MTHAAHMGKRIVCALSGGIDSLTATYLLKSKVGVYMKNWDENEEHGVCQSQEEQYMVENICKTLDIEFHLVNFVKEYWTNVFLPVLNEFQIGLSPNPDILCNSEIKFKHFLEYSIKNLQADAIATGHYAKNNWSIDKVLNKKYDMGANFTDRPQLIHARDIIKDQTFFLANVTEKALSKVIFPLGNITKDNVKSLVKNHPVLSKFYRKQESMGICFVGKRRKFDNFLSQYISSDQGDEDNNTLNPIELIDVNSSQIIGYLKTHNNNHNLHLNHGEDKDAANDNTETSTCSYITIGQRIERRRMIFKADKRFLADRHKFYVVRKALEKNKIYVSTKWDHPSLYSRYFITRSPYWINGALDNNFYQDIRGSCCNTKCSSHSYKWLECDYRHINIEGYFPCRIFYNFGSVEDIPIPIRDPSIKKIIDKDGLLVELKYPNRSLTPGQYAVFYKNSICLGNARIIDSLPQLQDYNSYYYDYC